MHFDNSFSVPKPINEVWTTMLDLERVIPCVPDARVLEKIDDKSVKAEIKIRLGSMSMQYSGPASSRPGRTPGCPRSTCCSACGWGSRPSSR